MEKRTLVIGASPNPERFSNRAINALVSRCFPVVAVGLREGIVRGVTIQKPFPELENIHTVTLYVGPLHQPFYYNFVIQLEPQRVIFNPGTENPDFEFLLREKGIEIVWDCTLVMLANGTY